MADRLEELEEDDVDLGVVKISEATTSKPTSVSLTLKKDGPLGDLPKDYELHHISTNNSMYVFSESNLNRKNEANLADRVVFEGKVEREFQTRPVLNEDYRTLMKNRNEDSNKPKRSIQVVDNVQDGVKLGIVVPISENDLLMRKKKKNAPELKRERLPKPELMDLLFAAFEKYTHWSLKGLVEYSNQPTIYLREVLNEICLYIKRGPYKNMFQLRPEYRRSSEAASSRPAVQMTRSSAQEEEEDENEHFEMA